MGSIENELYNAECDFHGSEASTSSPKSGQEYELISLGDGSYEDTSCDGCEDNTPHCMSEGAETFDGIEKDDPNDVENKSKFGLPLQKYPRFSWADASIDDEDDWLEDDRHKGSVCGVSDGSCETVSDGWDGLSTAKGASGSVDDGVAIVTMLCQKEKDISSDPDVYWMSYEPAKFANDWTYQICARCGYACLGANECYACNSMQHVGSPWLSWQSPMGRPKTGTSIKKAVETKAIADINLHMGDPSFNGYLCVRGWSWRYGKQLGPLKTFLQSRPDLYTITGTKNQWSVAWAEPN